MYKIGDKVLYGAEGICEITGIEEKKIDTRCVSYYTLCPVSNKNSLFYVPKDGKIAQTKLKKLLCAKELIDIMSSAAPASWIENDRERRDKYNSAINESDRAKIASYIKAIDLKSAELLEMRKKIHKIDEYFMAAVEKLFYGELSLVFEIEKNQVIPFILGKETPTVR